MKKMVLFDIDGTLLVTGGCGKVAFENAFEELFSISNTWKNTNPDGKTDAIIIEEIAARELKRSLEPHEYTRLCERYIFHFRKSIERPPDFRLMPGIPDLLIRLERMPDMVLGIATGNLEEAAWMKLKAGAIEIFFKFGGFGSDSAQRFEIVHKAIERGCAHAGTQIRPDHIYVVGDTAHDVSAAKKAGVRAVGVATGTKGMDEFKLEKPDFFLNDLSDTASFLKILANGC